MTDNKDKSAGLCSETMQDQPTAGKRSHKPSKRNQLANDTYVITRVDGRGVPVSPLKAASGYINAIGVFVCETINITCQNIRAKEQLNIQEVLFNKLFNKYSLNFDGDDEQSMHIKKTVKHNALKMMTKV
jgi:hypothetical protein